MDSRRLMMMLAVAAVLFLVFQWFFPGALGGNKNAAPILPNALYNNPATQPSIPHAGDKLETFTLGSALADSKDKLAITVDNLTAGVDLVQLNVNDYAEYPKSPQHPNPEPLTLLKAVPGLPKPFSTLGIHLTIGNSPGEYPLVTVDDPQKQSAANSAAIYQHQTVWTITKETPTEVDMRMRFFSGQSKDPDIEVYKIFQIDPASYEVRVSHHINNLSKLPIKIAIDQMAATDMPRDNIQMDDRFYHAIPFNVDKGIVEDKSSFNFTHAELQRLDTGTKDVGSFNDFAATKTPFLWIATSNRFFATITRPLPLPTDATVKLDDAAGRTLSKVSQIASANIDLLSYDKDDASKTVGGVRLNGASVNVAPGTSADLPLTIYFGPKKRDILDGKANAAPGTDQYAYALYDYSSVIQLSSSYCYSFCTFNFLADFLLYILNILHTFMPWHNYGIAIMLLVLIVRLCMHPLTRRGQISMAVMQKKMKVIQPMLETAKKKYAKDSKKLQEEQMRIYRENSVNPAGSLLGCLPMLIQMPIWVALYSGLRTDIDLRHAMFIPGWINDLSNPDALFSFAPFTLPIVGTISTFNLLPLLLGIVFFFQMKVQTASQPAPSDANQANMQKISQYFILVIPIFLYNASSGLILYMFASTGGGLIDTYFVRKTLRKKGILPSNASALPTHEEDDDEDEK